MSTPHEFMRQMGAFQKASDGGMVNLQTLVEKVVAHRLVNYSPVDTGLFRGNWQFGASGAPEGTLETVDPDGQDTIARLAEQIDAAGPGVHTFANNLPYAMDLEMGHSSQAPQGIVARIAAEFPDIVADGVQP